MLKMLVALVQSTLAHCFQTLIVKTDNAGAWVYGVYDIGLTLLPVPVSMLPDRRMPGKWTAPTIRPPGFDLRFYWGDFWIGYGLLGASRLAANCCSLASYASGSG